MAFIDELESMIQAAYLSILKKNHLTGKNGKTLNCSSFRRVAETIKSVIVEGSSKGLTVFEIANNIIFKMLNAGFFVYANNEMAALIGYIYLKRQGVAISHYTAAGINNSSTLDEIKTVTASW